MKAAIYARVSTDRQESMNQVAELREYAARQGWEIVREYVDEDVRGKDRKPQLEALLLDAHQRRFDVAIFWALDRLTRAGVKDAIDILHRLGSSGVDFVSFRESYLTSLGPFRDTVVGILATIANVETARMSERIKAASRARRPRGSTSGGRRPRIPSLQRRSRRSALRALRGAPWPPSTASRERA
jgi:DNA invertase Pin-like site-specific DNA recombinase